MRKVLLKTTLLPLTLLFGASAVAAGTPAFDDLDSNGDGMLSAEETVVVEGLNLETADTDGDSALSRKEFEAASTGMPGGAEGSSSMESSTNMEGSANMEGSTNMEGSASMEGSSTMDGSTMVGTSQKNSTTYE